MSLDLELHAYIVIWNRNSILFFIRENTQKLWIHNAEKIDYSITNCNEKKKKAKLIYKSTKVDFLFI